MRWEHWEPEKVINTTKERAENALVLIGALGVGWVSDQLRANGYSEATKHPTGNLVNSITYSTSDVQGPLKGRTDGKQLSAARKLAVKIGTSVVYGPRVEFGFVGRDSLGRNYHQAAKPYLRTALAAHKGDILAVFGRAKRG